MAVLWYDLLFSGPSPTGKPLFADVSELASKFDNLESFDEGVEVDKVYKRSSVVSTLSKAYNHGTAIPDRLVEQIVLVARRMLENRKVPGEAAKEFIEQLHGGFKEHAGSPVRRILKASEGMKEQLNADRNRATCKFSVRRVSNLMSASDVEARISAVVESLRTAEERRVSHVFCMGSMGECVEFWRRVFRSSADARMGNDADANGETRQGREIIADGFLDGLEAAGLLQVWTIPPTLTLTPFALYDPHLTGCAGYVLFNQPDGTITPYPIPVHYIAAYREFYNSLVAGEVPRRTVTWKELREQIVLQG